MVLLFFSSEELRRLFLTQETELMRIRLLNAPPGEREEMIARYPEHLPLKRVVIPTVAELVKREENGEVIPKADKLLSAEIGKVYPIAIVKQEEHSVKDEKKSDKNQKESDGSSGQSKSGSAGKETNRSIPEITSVPVQLPAQPNGRDYYKVCPGCTDFVVNYRKRTNFRVTPFRGLNFRGDKFSWVSIAHRNYCC